MGAVTVVHVEAEHKFVAQLADGEALLRYAPHPGCLNFLHTFVPDAARNKGVAEQVVLAGFQYAQAHGLKVVPTCPYISHAFLKRHPEFQSLVTSAC